MVESEMEGLMPRLMGMVAVILSSGEPLSTRKENRDGITANGTRRIVLGVLITVIRKVNNYE